MGRMCIEFFFFKVIYCKCYGASESWGRDEVSGGAGRSSEDNGTGQSVRLRLRLW